MGGNPLGSGWLSIIGGGTVLGGLVGITMYVKHRSRRDAVTPASDDYHRLTEPRREGALLLVYPPNSLIVRHACAWLYISRCFRQRARVVSEEARGSSKMSNAYMYRTRVGHITRIEAC